jgi:hypothetical protein
MFGDNFYVFSTDQLQPKKKNQPESEGPAPSYMEDILDNPKLLDDGSSPFFSKD